MLNLPKVSVIVPVYNVEDYLNECIDSLINQTLDDIEIICVDDGSTDSSAEILRGYEDERIKIITHENGGLSVARNTGLEHVSGEYIYFIDSDDILCENALEIMYNTSQEKSLDMLIFKLINFDDDTKEKFSSPYYDMEFLKESVGDDVFSHSDVAEYVFDIAVTIQSKFFRKDLIGDLRFIEGYIFEDNPFFIETFFKAKRVYFLDEYLYLKRLRLESITSTHNDKFFDIIPISDILIDISKKYGVYESYKESLFKKILRNIYLRFSLVRDEYKDEFFIKLKEFFSSKSEEFENDKAFLDLEDNKMKEIYYSAIESQNAREYELSIKCIDFKKELEKTEKKLQKSIKHKDEILKVKNKYNKQKVALLHRSKELSFKLNELSNENKQLKKRLN